MSAPFDQDDEPTAMFVPSWDDDDREDELEAPAVVVADHEPAVHGEVEPEPLPLEVVSDVEPDPEPDVEPEPEAEPTAEAQADVLDDGATLETPPSAGDDTVEADPVAAITARDGTGPGTLRPLVPEPVAEARRARSPAPTPHGPSAAGRAWEPLRAASGLLVLVVVAGVGVAAVIGLVVLGMAFVLRQAVGS